MKLKNIFS